MKSSPFDHKPIRDLGRALREVLDAGDNRAFVARVMEEVRAFDVRRLGSDWWEILGAWARPGLAAAAVLMALAVGLTVAGGTTSTVDEITAEDALRATTEASVLTVAAEPPDVEFILAAYPER
jgi:hypothetical protein